MGPFIIVLTSQVEIFVHLAYFHPRRKKLPGSCRVELGLVWLVWLRHTSLTIYKYSFNLVSEIRSEILGSDWRVTAETVGATQGGFRDGTAGRVSMCTS